MALTLSGSGITSANIVDGTITNTDINASAAIAGSKLSGTGKVLQVVNAVNTTYAATSSATYTDTGLTATITPTSTSSKILVIVSAGLGNTSASTNNNARLMRDATEIASFSRVSFSGGGHANAHHSFTDLDSPATTSATVYKLQYMTDTGAFRFNESSGDSPSAVITLMEIGA